MNYRLQQPGKHADTQIYRINILKKLISSGLVVSSFASHVTDLQGCALVARGNELTPAQQQELAELMDQFADIFLSVSGLTQLVQHEIKTFPRMVVWQRLYWVLESRH